MTGLVLLNYHAASLIEEMLGWLKHIPSIQEIAIVDNSVSPEETARLKKLERPGVSVLVSPENGGYSKGNNLGFRYLVEKKGCDILFLANPDVVFGEDTVKKLISAFRDFPDYGALSPQMLNHEGGQRRVLKRTMGYGETLLSCFLSESVVQKKQFVALDRQEHRVLPVGNVWGSFFAITAEALQAIGYLDEGVFLYREEEILGWKLTQAGYRLGILSDADFVHNHVYSAESREKRMRCLRLCQKSNLYYWGQVRRCGALRLCLLNLCQKLSVGIHALAFTLRGIR